MQQSCECGMPLCRIARISGFVVVVLCWCFCCFPLRFIGFRCFHRNRKTVVVIRSGFHLNSIQVARNIREHVQEQPFMESADITRNLSIYSKTHPTVFFARRSACIECLFSELAYFSSVGVFVVKTENELQQNGKSPCFQSLERLVEAYSHRARTCH